ncbi:MAG: hypothetical protein ABSD71_07805 [Bacteroidales bacterium]
MERMVNEDEMGLDCFFPYRNDEIQLRTKCREIIFISGSGKSDRVRSFLFTY